MIDHDLKCIFIHIPATGGSIIEKSLTGKDWQEIDPRTKHMNNVLCQIHYEEYCDYFKFTFVRNPWDWFVSMYSKQRPKDLKGISFKDYILYYHMFRNMNWEYPLNRMWVPFSDNFIELDMEFIGKFENLEEDFKTLCQKLGVKKKLLSEKLHSNKSQRDPDYRKYYNKETKLYVETLFEEDIRRFGYEF